MGPVSSTALHVHRYGPPKPMEVLALHGLAGHGRRWHTLADQYLADIAVVAPDLIGHGRSSWSAPWTVDANVQALAALIEDETSEPALVVGHSFGGMIALHLAAARPDLVAGLVLLDPAIGLDGAWMLEIAEAMLKSPDYSDRSEARTEKLTGAWSDVPATELDDDLDEHLIPGPDGRWAWRICLPAMMSYWSELARPITLPPRGIPTTLVRATRTVPPYISEELTDGLAQRLGTNYTARDFDCQHMVAQAKPAETAAVIRSHLGRT
jgi:lipase